MIRKTEKRIEKLAFEVVDQMDLDSVIEAVRDQLEASYSKMSNKEFDKVWRDFFGEE